MLHVFSDGTQILCIGLDAEQNDVLLKTVEHKNKKYQIKNVVTTGLTNSAPTACLSQDAQTLVLCDSSGNFVVFRVQKLKLLF